MAGMSPRRPENTALPLPSDAELRILRQLWIGGEQTVREVHEHLEGEWPVGYTTILKLLQRMLEKGLVARRAEGRMHWYRAAAPRERTERRLVRHIVDRVFGGSVGELLHAALPPSTASDRELEEIRRVIARLAGGA